MAVVIEKIKFLVVRTGYTFRLISKTESIEEELDEDDLFLYIHDKIWGTGFYRLSRSPDVDYVRSKVSDDGVVVLRADDVLDAMAKVRMLTEQRYCACFGLESLYRLKLIDDILVLYYDCESG